MDDPQQRKMLNELINDPEVDRGGLVGTAFAMGVISAISEIESGHFVLRTGKN